MPESKPTNKDYNLPFPTRLRFLLEEKGKGSQSQLADYIGVTRQAISAYSLGNSVPDIYKSQKMAEFFNVPLEFMLGESDNREHENIDIGKATGLTDEVINSLKSYIDGDMETSHTRFSSIDRWSVLNSFLEDKDFYNLLDIISSLIGDNLICRNLALCSDEKLLNNSVYPKMVSLVNNTAASRYSEACECAARIILRIEELYVNDILDGSRSDRYNDKIKELSLLEDVIETLEAEATKNNRVLKRIRQLYTLTEEATGNGDDHEKK